MLDGWDQRMSWGPDQTLQEMLQAEGRWVGDVEVGSSHSFIRSFIHSFIHWPTELQPHQLPSSQCCEGIAWASDHSVGGGREKLPRGAQTRRQEESRML